MNDWRKGLKPEQLLIAEHSGSPLRIIAGPGTGKTYSLKKRVIRLLKGGENPINILAVTFTNVAADALKKELRDDLDKAGIEGAINITACTLHSLCFRILMEERVLKITGRHPRPLMNYEVDFLVYDLADKYGGLNKTAELIKAYEASFARELDDEVGVIKSSEDARFKNDLLKWLKFHQAMLVGEVIPETIDYLTDNPDAPEINKYKHILVDEYQDLNKSEQTLIELLCGKNCEVVIVGDEDQSIYKFRYAHREGILKYKNKGKSPKDVYLVECRRCPKKVVRLANEFMGYELEDTKKHKILKEFGSNNEGTIEIVKWKKMDDEIGGISKLVNKILKNYKHIVEGDILILCPLKKSGHDLKINLTKEYNIKSRTFFDEDALYSEMAKFNMSLLKFLVNPSDRVSLRVLLGMPTPISKTYKKIEENSLLMMNSPSDILEMLLNGEITISRSQTILKRYSDIKQKIDELRKLELKDLAHYLFPDNKELGGLCEIVKQINLDKINSPSELYNEIQSRIMFSRFGEVPEDIDFVRIMSLHKSKGLSARVVVIMSCIEGLIPRIKNELKLEKEGKTNKIKAIKEEQERLLFVSMTRTKKYLLFSSFGELEFGQALNMGLDNSKFKYKNKSNGKVIVETLATSFFKKMRGNLPIAISGEDFIKKHQL